MSEPIRVLQVFALMNRGGAETMIMNLYRNIDRSKVQFDFIVHTEENCAFDDEIKSLGGHIFRVPRYTFKNHFLYTKAWEEFFKQHPEYKIIHGHVRSTASVYLKIAKNRGLITIAHSHSTSSRGNKSAQFVKNIIQLPIRYTADYLFACSDESGQWLFGERAIRKENYRLIKNAIDLDKFAFNEVKRNEKRKSLKIENKFVIGHVGSFTYPKNHKFLIDVFLEVQRRVENVVLLLVGDGELRNSINAKVDKLGLSDSVIFTGVRSDVAELFQTMDIFLFPSLFEGLPVTLIEAQASGLRCIVSDTITDEVKITDQVEFISLEQSSEYWAEKVLHNSDGSERKKDYADISGAGYDVKDNAEWLKDFYLNLCNQEKGI